MIIREMTAGDLGAVLEIEKLCFSDPWPDFQFLRELDNPEIAHPFVLEDDGKILGYCDIWLMFDNADITNIAVHPDHRRKGYGELMLSYMIDFAGHNQVEFIHLEVRVSNLKAISLYKKLGFEIIRTRKGYYSDNGEDAYDMLLGIGGLYEEDTCDREQL